MQSAPQSVCLALQPEDAKDRGMPAPPYTYPQGVPAAGFPARQPRDHVVWSLFNFAFFNVCCLGFLALLFSFKSRDRKVVGDTESATSYGRTAKSLNIAAMVLGIVFFILFIVLLASNIEQLQHYLEQQRNSINYFQRNNGK